MKGLYTEKIKTFIKKVRKGMSTFDAYFTKGVEKKKKKKYELALGACIRIFYNCIITKQCTELCKL